MSLSSAAPASVRPPFPTRNLLKIAAGCNGAALVRGARLGFGAFLEGCLRSFDACRPLENLGGIPEVDLDDILQGATCSIELLVQPHQDGMVPWRQAVVLLSLLVREQPAEVLEIGTFCGHTTRLMARNLPQATIHTLDLPKGFSAASAPSADIPKDDFHLIAGRRLGREFEGQPEAARIVQHLGDSATWDFSQAGRPTFFFIDGSHTYEYCKNDSEKCLALCEGRGIFLWHDCDSSHPGVVRFVREWREKGRDLVRIRDTDMAYWKSF